MVLIKNKFMTQDKLIKNMTKKTYKTTIEKNCLEITHDTSLFSPREDTNLGYFITVDRDYQSPDNNKELIDIITDTGNEATSQDNHMELIKKRIKDELNENIVTIYPVNKYEHSGVAYSLGAKHGFDYSNNGFYIITDKTQKEVGTDKKSFESVVNQELGTYNKYINGEVYAFALYDENGEVVDSCGGFYNIEDIREQLPSEYKNDNLNDYFINN